MLRITESLSIPEAEIQEQFIRGGMPLRAFGEALHQAQCMPPLKGRRGS